MRYRRQDTERAALDRRPIARGCRALIAAILLVQLFSGIALGATGFTTLADFPVPGGHFYSQASGQGLNAGFAVVDDDTGLLFTEFERLGSVDRPGYPSPQRFSFNGFLTPATQKALLQWRSDSGRAAPANIIDILSHRGVEPTLAKTPTIPPTGD